jgi:phage terminase large subunit-like protein
VDLIGHSPDEADALVLAVHAMLGKARKPTAGILGD